MNGHVNAYSWYQSKKRKENSSMLKTNKQLNKGTKTQKHKKGAKTEAYDTRK